MASQTDRHSGEEYNPKLVYSSKKIVLQFFNMEYLNFWAGEIAPIWGKKYGVVCVAAYSKNR